VQSAPGGQAPSTTRLCDLNNGSHDRLACIPSQARQNFSMLALTGLTRKPNMLGLTGAETAAVPQGLYPEEAYFSVWPHSYVVPKGRDLVEG